MARIRSIHPGLFTDEAFMSASPHARTLLIGLWCEADDLGLFEWKPLTLKARILPADNIDLATLLDELVSLGCIKQFEIAGRALGAVRNFRKFQRPQKPHYTQPFTEEVLSYVAISEKDRGSLPDHSATGTGKVPQMEEEGGNRKREKKKDGADAPDDDLAFRGKVIRLTKSDYDDWRKAYARLDLDAELVARDAYLDSDKCPDDVRKRWFLSTSSHLANRNQTAKARASPPTEVFQKVAL